MKQPHRQPRGIPDRQPQSIPVRVYQTEDHIVVAAPMPGLEPTDISVSVVAKRLIIRGMERGPGQHERNILIDEWTIGPYYREVPLPQPVNGPLTNVTYGNGVLVVSIPKRKRWKRSVHGEIQLQPLEATRGAYVGHTGSAIHPTTVQAPARKRQSDTVRRSTKKSAAHSRTVPKEPVSHTESTCP